MKSAAHLRFWRFAVLSQSILAVPLVVCYMMWPHIYRTQGGVSNFGQYAPTSILYIVALGGCALFTLLMATSLPDRFTLLRMGLYCLSAIFLLVLATTYHYATSKLFGYVHRVSDVLLAISQLLLGSYLVLAVRFRRLAWVFYGLQIAGTCLLYLTTRGVGLLFDSQQITQVAFGSLLLTAAASLTF